jgi:hypothetical protein
MAALCGSEVEGRTGNGTAGRHEIDLATFAIDDGHTPPDWLGFYDRGRLNSFARYAALAAGDHAETTDRLNPKDLFGPGGLVTGEADKQALLAQRGETRPSIWIQVLLGE